MYNLESINGMPITFVFFKDDEQICSYTLVQKDYSPSIYIKVINHILLGKWGFPSPKKITIKFEIDNDNFPKKDEFDILIYQMLRSNKFVIFPHYHKQYLLFEYIDVSLNNYEVNINSEYYYKWVNKETQEFKEYGEEPKKYELLKLKLLKKKNHREKTNEITN